MRLDGNLMDSNAVFSKFYSKDTNKYEDKTKFRARILKYLEDFINFEGEYSNSELAVQVYTLCREKMGLDLEKKQEILALRTRWRYYIEKTFTTIPPKPIDNILDFITIVFYPLNDAVKSSLPNSGKRLHEYVETINRIFSEESMVYFLHDNGCVRYYPDEEFQGLVRSTLIFLDKSKYVIYSKAFNEVLDDFYENRNTESPIYELFKCIERFVLSFLGDEAVKPPILGDKSISELKKLLEKCIGQSSDYAEGDKEALSLWMSGVLPSWIKMCHKYRHGKKDQKNNNVPAELFNCIFSTGVSIFRFLLEIDERYLIISESSG